jgi:threonine synthase
VTLGEGWTPLIDTPDFDCEFKLEYVFPTGIFKDRGAATTLSRAVEFGDERVVEDPSGNAGAAIATYAAHAGIDAEIYVPAEVKDSKLRAIRQASASVVRVSRSREAVTNACIERADGGRANEAAVENGETDDRNDDGESENERNDTEAWYASHT